MIASYVLHNAERAPLAGERGDEMRGAKGAEIEIPHASRGKRGGWGVPLQPTIAGLGERRN